MTTEIKVKKPRGANWTRTEEKQLAESWLSISQNPLVGANQTSDTFYQLVTEDFCKNNKENNRDIESVKHFWGRVNTALLKFSGIYDKIIRAPRSGTSPEDWLRDAKEMYAQSSKGQQFKHEVAWQKLRLASKYIVPQPVNLSIPKVPAFKASGDNEETPPTDLEESTQAHPHRPPSPERPVGNKKAKKARLDKFKEDEAREAALIRDGEAAKLAERRVKAMEDHNRIANEKMQLETDAQEMRFLAMDVNNMPDEASKAALRAKKARIIARMSLDAKDASRTTSPATGSAAISESRVALPASGSAADSESMPATGHSPESHSPDAHS